jgi:hypothetical protein
MATDLIYSRGEFIRLCGIKSNTFNQRAFQDENALAWGRRKPLHKGEYTPLDAIGMLLTSMVSYYVRIDMRTSSSIVVKYWREWLKGVAAAEREMNAPRPEQSFVVIGASFKDSKRREREDFIPSRITVGFGRGRAAAIEVAELEAKREHDTLFCLAMQDVIKALRANSQLSKVPLPDMLCPGPPESDAFEQWVKATTDHMSATDRAKSRAKATA